MSKIFASGADAINKSSVLDVPMSAIRGRSAKSAVKFLAKENDGRGRSEIRESSPGLELLARLLQLDLDAEDVTREDVQRQVVQKVSFLTSRAQHIIPCCAYFFLCFLLLCLGLAIGLPWYRTKADFDENGPGTLNYIDENTYYFTGVEVNDDFQSWDDLKNSGDLEQLYTTIRWSLIVGLVVLVVTFIPGLLLLSVPFESFFVKMRDKLIYKFILVFRIVLLLFLIFVCLVVFFLIAGGFLAFFDHPDRVNDVSALGCGGTNDKWCSEWAGKDHDDNTHVDVVYTWGPTSGWAFGFIFLYCAVFLLVCLLLTLVGDSTTAISLQLDYEGKSQEQFFAYFGGSEPEKEESFKTSSTRGSEDTANSSDYDDSSSEDM